MAAQPFVRTVEFGGFPYDPWLRVNEDRYAVGDQLAGRYGFEGDAVLSVRLFRILIGLAIARTLDRDPDGGWLSADELAAAADDARPSTDATAKFLSRVPAAGVKAWTARHRAWLAALQLELPALQVVLAEYLHEVVHSEQRVARLDTAIEQAVAAAPAAIRAVVEALQGLRGVCQVTAVGVVAEIGQFSRFAHPRQLMGYSGAVPSEFSTGGPGKHQRGAITKAGNAHLRRLLGEAAWCYRYRPAVRYPLKKRQQALAPSVIDISWKAQVRLCHRYRRMVTRGKLKQKVVIAVARELLAFMWAIGVAVEKHYEPPRAAAA